MMATESRPPNMPSRYKSIRRTKSQKSLAPSSVPPVPQVPVPPVPQIPGQTYIPIEQAQKLAQMSQLPQPGDVQQQPQRHHTLVERASPAKVRTQAPEAQKEHSSRFRRMLGLKTKSPVVQQEQESPSPSPVTSPLVGRGLFRQREEGHRREPSPEELERQRARDDAVAALEGKRPSRPSSKTRTPIDNPNKPNTPAYDMTLPLHFEGKPMVHFPIMKTMDAGALLQKVRPGHTRHLVELWPTLGLERPIRYFERVSDVVNTWDNPDEEKKSHVRVCKSAWGALDRRLEDFPKTERPSGETMVHYYVTADRKWVKRTMSIDVEGGSLRIVKKDRPKDKDYCQVVSLDTFDIYTFTNPKDGHKIGRCPGRYVFALKSQHKQTLFGKNSVFVHYFALDEDKLFIKWHAMIRDVKTRLLAVKMGIAPWEEPEEAQMPEQILPRSRPSSSHRPGKPKPLLSPEELAAPPQSNMSRAKSLSRNKSVKQPTGRSRAASANHAQPLIGSDAPVFAPGGLLGNDYESRRTEALRNFKADQGHDFIPAVPPIPINTRNITPRSPQQLASGGHSIHSNDEFSPLSRSTSRPGTAHAHGQQPLLQFSPLESMPPLPHQQQRRGRGHTVDASSSGGLINHATSFRPGEEHSPPPMPAASTLHRWNTTGKPPSSSHSYHHNSSPFTGTGLLANQQFHSTAGTAKFGHGVKTGMDAIGENGKITPLLNLENRGLFQQGSLLQQMESQMGPRGPVIDREEEERERARKMGYDA
ncbi:hypothetical protein EX30DRAFT_397075 [Ascodesmis nigricans]|uniref:PH domain-containing protein n=1 Tax=Ascodesmis nigricans TaxID=341454 RepID=A0A4S2MSW3_9PEZI|nr:hypothetical protein EX30DRAFT_397075 [Ascodesmis nigricans]